MVNGADLYELAMILCHSNFKITKHRAKLARQPIASIPTRRGKFGKLFERATPKVKFTAIDVRVLCAREIFTRFLSEANLLEGWVARDGIEPPTPAFSGPLTESQKWFEINGCH
jgi:hypothetical protein